MVEFGKKKKQTHIRRLSECKATNEKIAFCPKCEEFFIDDILLVGNVLCPNAGCGRHLQRGMEIKDGIVYSGGRKFRSLK